MWSVGVGGPSPAARALLGAGEAGGSSGHPTWIRVHPDTLMGVASLCSPDSGARGHPRGKAPPLPGSVLSSWWSFPSFSLVLGPPGQQVQARLTEAVRNSPSGRGFPSHIILPHFTSITPASVTEGTPPPMPPPSLLLTGDIGEHVRGVFSSSSSCSEVKLHFTLKQTGP